MERCLLALTIIAAAVAAGLWWNDTSAQASFIIEPTVFTPYPPLAAGAKTTVPVIATNRSNTPVRVLNIKSNCGGNCCYGSKQPTPFEIPANSQEAIECYLIVGNPGPYSGEVRIYVDAGGLREFVIRMKGEAVAKITTTP